MQKVFDAMPEGEIAVRDDLSRDARILQFVQQSRQHVVVE